MVAEKFRLGQAIERLEVIVERLEREELELEEALGLFDEGMELVRAAERELSESQGRLKQVLMDRQGRERYVELEVSDEEDETEVEDER